jgi:phosphatidylinositol kinase/protein kinase (PI-3  family)
MKSIYCPPYLLSSFFHRIFYNVDDLFIFKKQFTTFHAVNSFFSYAFNQFEFLTLNQISFCKTSGRLNFNEAKILEFVKNTQLKKHIQNNGNQMNIDYEALYKDDNRQLNYLPFRLTSNLVDFMGKIGLNGLFAGVMTSCSLAITKHNEKIMPLLQIVLRDEINKVCNDRDPTVIFLGQCCDYIKFKMTILS